MTGAGSELEVVLLVGEILPLMSLHGMRSTTNPCGRSAGQGVLFCFF